ncbi:HlyD family type I secretion periplasmic adaptor subunit [Bradyrhizobium sp. SYSU BS000235]|uniref:HlyD family type I secretion periplasmic adaptor subunit n=1 Tax=Bradyrhizobium sp. SYSU BS000235 TaxID=3411332 RepID=UPI003C70E69F
MQQSDFAFANDIRAAVELRTPRTARLILICTLALFLIGLIWAHFAVLDEVKRGNGRVIPTRQIQVVQSLEGGIVGAILVDEGAMVNQGQTLMRIEDTKFASEFGEIRERRAATAARVVRLEAEAAGKDKLVFPADLEKSAPKAVAAERSLYEARARKLAQDIDVVAQQETQRRREYDEYNATEVKLTETLKLLQREVDLTRNLFQQKVVPEIEMLRVDRQASEMRGQIEVIKASKAKASAAIQEAQSRLENAKTTLRAQADEDLAKSRGDLAVLDENIKAAKDRVFRTDLRSPVHGIVNKLNVTTIGAVVQPGANVMDIVPLDDTLLVEGRIRPQDIAFIRAGQDAVVKVTAYDSSVFGSLKGKVERISADAIVDDKAERGGGGEKNEAFYRVIVRTDKNHLGTTEHPLPIIPGMVTTVEVLTGSKSVLDYLVKPARMLREEALRER